VASATLMANSRWCLQNARMSSDQSWSCRFLVESTGCMVKKGGSSNMSGNTNVAAFCCRFAIILFSYTSSKNSLLSSVVRAFVLK